MDICKNLWLRRSVQQTISLTTFKLNLKLVINWGYFNKLDIHKIHFIISYYWKYYTDKGRAMIGGYTSANSGAAAMRKFKRNYSTLTQATVQRMKTSY